MAKETLSKDMAIDILRYSGSSDIVKDCKQLSDIECFVKYSVAPELELSTAKVVTYVVLLYSRDSFLNRKPLDELKIRKVKSAKMAGLDSENESVIRLLFELRSEPVLNLITSYLIHQGNFAWMELIALQSQMEESIKLRMRPIDEGESKDKDIIEAFNKKAVATKHSQDWFSMSKSYEAEIFADHDDVKNQVKVKRSSLESLAK